MTIVAGAVGCHPSRRVGASTREALYRNVSRNPDDARIVLEDPRAYFVKVDIGAFGRPAHSVSPAGSLAMLAGEPLLTGPGTETMERDAQLRFLQAELDDGTLQSLRGASGTFCGAYFDPRSGTAHLIADRLALRPLYYAVVDGFLYFSSALRILESLSEISMTMDVMAVAEITGFGYPFGAGTGYVGVSVLQPCEVVTLRKGVLTSSRYFRWDEVPAFRGSDDQALDETRRQFGAAVKRRLRGDRTVWSYLSGGLDSRCTVAALREEGVHAYTFNFSLPQTQDQVFGRDFAARVGTVHEDVPTEPNPDWSAVMARALASTSPRSGRKPERPHLVWSGEGGSVGLGHVYFSPEIVGLLDDRPDMEAIDVFLHQQHKSIKTRILNPELAASLHGHLRDRLANELESIRNADPLRRLSIFLNSNGPRRHLVDHYNDNDLHRLEFLMPFFDAEFLEWVTSLPAEPCLYHRFYVRWLTRFDPAVLAVPWQAYPGHQQSPLPIPPDLPDQWTADASATHGAKERRDLLARSSALLLASDFPRPILSRLPLVLMYWAYRLRLLDYAYALKTALTYYDYWRATDGRHVLPVGRKHSVPAPTPAVPGTSRVAGSRDQPE